MTSMINILLFAEDVAQEKFVGRLVSRVAQDYSLPARLRIRSSFGGFGECGAGDAKLVAFQNDEFKIVQQISSQVLQNNPLNSYGSPEFGITVIKDDNDGNKIDIYKVSHETANNEDCGGVLYKTMAWDPVDCRFK